MDSPRPSLTTEEWSRHVAALRALARQLVHGVEEREDLVQGTLAAALERPPRALSFAWLARVLRNRARDLGRRRAARPEVPTSVELLEQRAAAGAAPDVAARLQLASELNAALAALDEPYRSTLYRRYFDGLTPLEIAQREGLPVRTVKSRLERGLAQLRERLRRSHGEDLAALLPLLAPLPHASTPWATPPVTVSSAPAGMLGGSLLMMKKLLVAVVLCSVFGAWWHLRARDSGRDAAGADEATVKLASELTGSTTALAPEARTTAREQATVEQASASLVSAARSACTLKVAVTWPDGSPAAGVHVDLRRNHAQLRVPATPLGMEVCDARGMAEFAVLAPGALMVRVERGSQATVELAAGETRTLTLSIAHGEALVGRVLDPEGRAVAGAEVWLLAETGPYDWLGMAPIARSDAEGRFQARDVPLGRSIGATAAGYGPSQLVALEAGRGGEPASVELVLAPEAVALSGRVLDPEGRGVAGARVCAGALARPEFAVRGPQTAPWAPRTTLSDADGRFELAGLAPGVLPLAVRAAGFAPWSEPCELEPGRADEVVVSLVVAAALEGVVRDEHGQPLENASVRAFAWAQPPNFLPMGQYDDPSVFGSPFALSGADGRYRLEDVFVGEVHLYASPPRGPSPRAEFHAELVLSTRSGTTAYWDPVLEPGPTVRGRLRFADQAPMPDHFVHLRRADAPEGDPFRYTVCSDEEGRFAFHNLEPVPYRLDVQLDAPPPGAKPLGVESILPGGPELELVASHSSPPGRGRVTGELTDPSGRCGEGLVPGLESELGVVYFADSFAQGRYEFRDVPEGTYRVLGLHEQATVALGAWFTLGPDDTFDAGRLEVVPAVQLTLRLRRDPSLASAEVRGALSTIGAPFAAMFFMGLEDELVLAASPGPQELRLWCAGSEQILRRFELAGPDSLELRLRPGAWAPVDLDWPPEHASTTLRIEITDAEGALVDQSAVLLSTVPRPYRYGPLVPTGRYRLRATTDSGLAGELELVVESLAAPSSIPSLELR